MRLTKVMIVPAIIHYMILLVIGLVIDTGRTHVNSNDARYHISINMVVIQDSILHTLIICIVLLGIVVSRAKYTMTRDVARLWYMPHLVIALLSSNITYEF